MTFVPNEDGINELYQDIGNKIRDIVNRVAQETKDGDIDTAVGRLRSEMTESGVNVNDEWCRDALETLRRGEPLTIRLH